jgi:hypothetical protein
MPSAYSAEHNAALVAPCIACQKTLPTALMITLTGCESGSQTHAAVCLVCAGNGWRPPGFAGVYQWQ